MPAHSDTFPWPSYYGNFDFFETAIRRHSKVSSLERIGSGLYRVGRKAGGQLRVFICECYSFGVAEYVEVVDKLGRLDVIVINSNWCGYTTDAKYRCYCEKVGVFNIGEFMKSLHHKDVWSYLDEADVKLFKERGWL
ncbi:hypothetical protein [Terrarubrum flagellatum]|uniref:hypothetical protein n=1 Tax=Terrirubrum flagellatum TaxID=2895980 RepID=UPI00314533B2